MSDSKDVRELFRSFKIKEEELPEYTSMDDFTSKIKICSILKEEEIVFSNNSKDPLPPFPPQSQFTPINA